jgi:methylated-DNA-[protein]-cysteine S-methyltransferase
VETSPAAISLEAAIGTVGIEATEAGLRRVRLPGDGEAAHEAGGDEHAAANAEHAARQLGEYLRGTREAFQIPLDWSGIEETHRRVLETLCEIAPFGTTVTYGELGERAGIDDPRDVGVLMASNPMPLVVPCHRVVAADGLGGYGGGIELKRTLLELEGVLPARLDLDL